MLFDFSPPALPEFCYITCKGKLCVHFAVPGLPHLEIVALFYTEGNCHSWKTNDFFMINPDLPKHGLRPASSPLSGAPPPAQDLRVFKAAHLGLPASLGMTQGSLLVCGALATRWRFTPNNPAGPFYVSWTIYKSSGKGKGGALSFFLE